ncbi:MAG: KpsF/GutQ family sugar-phosphate isomerase [Ignavibacteriales bacterium]|nr:KpsF/GutQ family sugar-phosphate isomerase [Ignavibacteriales bacterium]
MTDIEKGKSVIRIEAKAVAALEDRIDRNFARAVELIVECKGRVIITGMGKSGIIAKKIVATMNSTGTAALFLHPSDAVHGDLGMVRDEDVVVAISKSGDTKEILQLIPMFKRIGVPIIGMLGNTNSPLSRLSEIVLDVSVEEEACPHLMAPTTSTTVALAMGDALAVALLERRNFSENDFAMFHPGGNIGKRLLLKIEELMVSGDLFPVVRLESSLKDTILEMTSKRLGATCVVDAQGLLKGIVTDGDLRRLLQKTSDVSAATAEHIMTKNPKTIRKGMLAASALNEMESFNITQLVIVDEKQRPVGMVHLHDLVKAGLGGDAAGTAS